jgi:hypothetical protein
MGESWRCMRGALRYGLACGLGHVADDRLPPSLTETC